MMYVALSYDRLIDGKESVQFLVSVKPYRRSHAFIIRGLRECQNLHEYQAKALLVCFNLPVPKGV